MTINNSEDQEDENNGFNKYYNLHCSVYRKHVRHGVKEEGNIQKIVCLSCESEVYKGLKINSRNIVEHSLGTAYQKYKDKVDLNPPIPKKPKKKWKSNILFSRR